MTTPSVTGPRPAAPTAPPRLAGVRVAIVLKWPGLGGAERQALVVAEHLRKVEGALVEVHALNDAEGRARDHFREAGIPWRARRGRWRGGGPRTVARLARTAVVLRRARPDVLLPYCDVPNVVCGLVWRHAGARTCVWNQRDTLPFTLDERFVRRAIRDTPVLVSNSEHGADFLVARGARRDRIRVIANGVDLAPARASREEWRRRLGVPDDGVVVTSLAHFYVRKDHETLLAAWRRTLDQVGSTPVTLVLAGRPEGRRELLEALAEKLRIQHHVRFVGDVEDVAGLLAATDVGVLSSLPAEGCSNAVLEKMAFGLPVVASDIPGIPETLGSDRWPSVVAPSDPGPMGTALARLCVDPELRVRIGSHNARRQRALFAAERMLEETVAAILDGLALQRSLRRAEARGSGDPCGSPE
jgi:glycosyltransferase involved in cell wall biosynthesis